MEGAAEVAEVALTKRPTADAYPLSPASTGSCPVSEFYRELGDLFHAATGVAIGGKLWAACLAPPHPTSWT